MCRLHLPDKAFKKCPGEMPSEQSIDRLFQPGGDAMVPSFQLLIMLISMLIKLVMIIRMMEMMLRMGMGMMLNIKMMLTSKWVRLCPSGAVSCTSSHTNASHYPAHCC